MDAVSHTFKVEVTVPNNDRALRPGMYCKLILNFGNNNSVVVPDEAVVKQLGSGRHFVLYQWRRHCTPFRGYVGRHFDTNYEILTVFSRGTALRLAVQTP